MDIIFILKIIFLISSIPLVIVFYITNIFESIILELLLTVIIIDIILLKDLLNDKDYRKYKIKNPDKRKVNYITTFILVFSIFYFPKLLFKPILKYVNNTLMMIVMIFLYIIFMTIYGGFIYKILKELNNNKKSLNPLKKKPVITYSQLVASEINKINTYQKLITAENRLIVINKSGVYEFINFLEKGVLTGNINEEEWQFNERKIKNPFLLKGKNIYNYFISNSKTRFEVFGVWLVPRNNIVNLLEGNLKTEIYSKEKIDEIYNYLIQKYIDVK